MTEDSNVAVFGIGCVGLSILQGARAKKCKRIFAIDTNPSKKEWAMKFGASESSWRQIVHSLPSLQPTLSTLKTWATSLSLTISSRRLMVDWTSHLTLLEM
jgi:Zn-dependent alcohol dehydrogenase